jgi:hypothetical protein
MIRHDQKLHYIINNIVNSQAELSSNFLANSNVHGRTDSSIVASLTTLKDRLDFVHTAVESVIMQTIRPRIINLYISDTIQEKDIPYSLGRLREFGLLIHFVPDVGPHTKLIYALRDFPEDLIFTFDDDVIYPSNTIACLLGVHKKYPDAIAANWAREIPLDRHGRPKCIKKGKLLTPATLTRSVNQGAHTAIPSHRAFAYGTGGVLYPPKALDPRVQDISAFKQLCPTEDDIWFKAMAILAGTPVVPTNLGIQPKHHVVRGSQMTALRHQNYKKNRNQEQMNAVFEKFALADRLKG